jgi:hypothetical protein
VFAIARTDSGLTSLVALHIRETKVTDAGANAIRARWPMIEITR